MLWSRRCLRIRSFRRSFFSPSSSLLFFFPPVHLDCQRLVHLRNSYNVFQVFLRFFFATRKLILGWTIFYVWTMFHAGLQLWNTHIEVMYSFNLKVLLGTNHFEMRHLVSSRTTGAVEFNVCAKIKTRHSVERRWKKQVKSFVKLLFFLDENKSKAHKLSQVKPS